MKKHFILLGALLLILLSCQDKDDLLSSENTDSSILTKSITKTKSPYIQWDDVTSIRSKYYGDIIFPWYNGASVQLPEFIKKDYKSEDGWELVYNFISDSPVVEKDKNYFILYNKFTGILRVFYNHRVSTGTVGTTFWKFSLNNRSALLNGAATHFTEPANIRKDSPSIYTSNITTVESKSIYRGWNCFDVEMCYDPKQKNENLRMSIGSYAMDKSKIKLEGGVDLKSKGTIITGTTNKYSGPINSFAKKAGSEAKGFIGKLLQDSIKGDKNENKFKKVVDKFPSILKEAVPAILSGGTTALVKAGINLVFGSFLGRANRPVVQDLRFTTTGSVKLEGEMTKISGSEVVPVGNLKVPGTVTSSSDHFLPSYDKPLGVWNLRNKPLLLISREKNKIFYSFDDPRRDYTFLGNNESRRIGGILDFYINYNFNFVKSSVNVEINPEVRSSIDRYTVESKLFAFEKCKSTEIHTLFTPIYGEVLYSDAHMTLIQAPKFRPNIPKGKVFTFVRREKFYSNEYADKFVVKVTVTLYPKAPYNQDPIIMTRSYIPEYKLVD